MARGSLASRAVNAPRRSWLTSCAGNSVHNVRRAAGPSAADLARAGHLASVGDVPATVAQEVRNAAATTELVLKVLVENLPKLARPMDPTLLLADSCMRV